MDLLWQIAIALIPSVGIGFLFYKVIKAIVEGDRNERLAYAQWQARHDAESSTPQERSVPEEELGSTARRD